MAQARSTEGPSWTHQHRPDDTVQAELKTLAEVEEAEERDDRREAQRRREWSPRAGPGHQEVPGFADGGVALRD